MQGPNVPASAAMWTASTKNRKTGDVPTMAVGSTREQSLDSCEGCALRPKKRGGNGKCYAQGGTPAMGHSSMIRAAANGATYTLQRALSGAKRSAKMARFGSIGDPGALPLEYLNKAANACRNAGLDVVGYTHHWRVKPALAGLLMASCDDISQVDQALAMGFRAAVVLPWDHVGRFTTPNGAKGIVCPAMVKEGLTCNDCRLCDGSKRGPVIGFPDHGPTVQHLVRKRKRDQVADKARSWLAKLDI